ncbi:hypothetical protein KM176_00835 [Pseudooceanicola sp. CBS1P-1]|uniref:Uncharacterized protein n=1 Tax=Pseudooceanicola albus TaxID=2692189 RepID=A0A6L7G2X5_9RHOB|nr:MULTISPECIES: hypothetical protein [Pseudooceanicola]MBT9382392.1 hypothetical protein [Pseudooceanicola endophyticus]MXN16933.1 hypothetical protein [Pseudooceanicola albus]
MKGDRADPKALIREAYRIEAITEAECRSILMDWALSLPPDQPQEAALKVLLQRHGEAAPGHPMSALLRQGLDPAGARGRRGGWRARRTDQSPG